VPARAGAVVEANVTEPRAAILYKERAGARHSTAPIVMSASESTEPAPEPVVPVNPVETGVTSIPDEAHRQAVTTRMEEMAASALRSKKALEAAQEQLTKYRAMESAGSDATKEAIAMWMESLGPDVAARWRINQLPTFEEQHFPSHFVRNMVCASHDRIVQLQGSPAAPQATVVEQPRAAKRARPESAAPAPAAAAAAPSNALRAALASTFDV